ncbi:MAG TPA: DoxX family membrane protein, partial [Acidimicrobiia bacterium]
MIFVHGWRHLAVTRGGPGIANWFEGLGLKPGQFHAWNVTLTELAVGVVLVLGFLLLLVALQAPLIAAAGVLTNLLATGAAFGVAKWIFQDGVGHSLLGFQSQGFLDAWGPVFF